MNVNVFAFAIHSDSQWLMYGAKGHDEKSKNVIIGAYNELPLAKSLEIVSEQRSFPTCSGDLGHYPVIYILEKAFEK